jgi:DNA-binding FrmR family transcriptional regulator
MDSKHKHDVLARLKSVEGHLRGIERMVEEDKYCVDIIKQTLAVQRAIDKINALMLENHLSTCVTTAIRSEDGQERERVIGEIVDVFQATNKL